MHASHDYADKLCIFWRSLSQNLPFHLKSQKDDEKAKAMMGSWECAFI